MNQSNSNRSSKERQDENSLFILYAKKCYELPSDLKDDVIYCQRAMRDFLKVHVLVSEVFKEQVDADQVEMQRILNELEAEIYEINAEQNFLMLLIEDDFTKFYRTQSQFNNQPVSELWNEYISRQIVPLIPDASYKITPQSVQMRDNEETLIRRHFLISPDSDDDDDDVELIDLDEFDISEPLLLEESITEFEESNDSDLSKLDDSIPLPTTDVASPVTPIAKVLGRNRSPRAAAIKLTITRSAPPALPAGSNISECGQEGFLKLFGLCTHEMVKQLSQRRSKRRRRRIVKE